jgi:hypothetical protein
LLQHIEVGGIQKMSLRISTAKRRFRGRCLRKWSKIAGELFGSGVVGLRECAEFDQENADAIEIWYEGSKKFADESIRIKKRGILVTGARTFAEWKNAWL